MHEIHAWVRSLLRLTPLPVETYVAPVLTWPL